MLSLGACVASTFDGQKFAPKNLDNADNHYYTVFQPCYDEYVPEALEVANIDRDWLIKNGNYPGVAMEDFARWINARTVNYYNPVFVAWPLSFDWTFVWWYFNYFDVKSPFGFSNCLDMKTMLHRYDNRVMKKTIKNELPKEFKSVKAHTHNALDDAIEQADIFNKIFEATMKKGH